MMYFRIMSVFNKEKPISVFLSLLSTVQSPIPDSIHYEKSIAQ